MLRMTYKASRLRIKNFNDRSPFVHRENRHFSYFTSYPVTLVSLSSILLECFKHFIAHFPTRFLRLIKKPTTIYIYTSFNQHSNEMKSNANRYVNFQKARLLLPNFPTYLPVKFSSNDAATRLNVLKLVSVQEPAAHLLY